jgi:hypothetical protein
MFASITYGWYFDSGATKHESGTKKHFDNIKKCNCNLKITKGKNHVIVSNGIINLSLPSREKKMCPDFVRPWSINKFTFYRVHD